ncbi:hypothetical protein OsJ_06424 [Oryza sativa Japonica Group]|uniref:Uncharacterized protein n=1 Tax=Oryza sativa subsp. japonica TaxID=39947 RepID=B9F592_ORYSJ|nr:hypothetical protein OsJ_06424 [Oryza sativa Japonica Group]
MGNGDEGVAEAGTPGYRSCRTPVAWEWGNGVGVGLVSVEVVKERLLVAAATPSPGKYCMARRAVSPLPSIRGRRSTAPATHRYGEARRQPETEAEEEQPE